MSTEKIKNISSLTRKQVAEQLSIPLPTLKSQWNNLLAQGLRAYRLGNRWRVRVSELERFLAKLEETAA